MKIAVITGAGVRIGKGIAENLLAANYQVILHAHNSFEVLTKWTQKSPHRDRILALVHADLGHENGQDHFCQHVKKITSRLDLIVNSASVFSPMAFDAVDRKSFRSVQAINLEAPFFIVQSLLSLLRATSNPSIINILDALWERPKSRYSPYAVSKAGLAILTKSLALELAPQIRVNAVAPGAIIFPPFFNDESKRQTIEKIPFHRLGEVGDIGDAVVFLASALYVTGEILTIDGGRALYS